MRKRPATNVFDTTLVLVPRAANKENQWHTKNLRNVLLKRDQSINKNHSKQLIKAKRSLKRLIETLENREERETL